MEYTEKLKTGINNRNGKWIIDKRYRISEGGERINFTAKTKQELIDKAIMKMKEIDKRIEEGIEYRKSNKTLKYFFDLYAIERNWSEYTKHKQHLMLIKYFQEWLGEPVYKIKEEKIIQWYKNIMSLVNRHMIQKHYANKLFRMIKGIMRIAYEEGCLPKKLDLSFILDKSVSDDSRTNPLINDNYITENELIFLCEQISKLPKSRNLINEEDFCFILSFLFYSGCRINEARAIQVKDIIFEISEIENKKIEVCYINVCKQLEDYKMNVMPIKNKKARKTFIVSEFQTEIKMYLAKKEFGPNDYIFDIKKTGHSLTRKQMYDAINNNLTKLKKYNLIEENFIQKLTPHGLRYSNTLFFEQRGIKSDIAAANRGHTEEVMLNIYSRLDKDFINKYFMYDEVI